MTKSELTSPADGPADETEESPGLWGGGITPHSLDVLAEFAEWHAQTQAPNLADFVEKALVQAFSEATLGYSLDSGGLVAEFPNAVQYDAVAIQLPDKVTEQLEDVNGGQMGVPPSTEELEGLARTRAMLTRWLELVDARLALPTEEGEP